MNDWVSPHLLDQLVQLFAALILFTSFTMLAQNRLLPLLTTFAWQGILLAACTATVALAENRPHLWISALLALSLKGVLIPWMLRRMVLRLDMTREHYEGTYPTLVLLIAGALVIFSYDAVMPIIERSSLASRDVLAISISIVLIGMLHMISRRRALTQVVGFMSIENGLFFAAVSATEGMPMVVELGIAFDVLIAAVLFGVIFLQIQTSFDSMDTDQLSRLAERDD